ncbi:MAG TPA: HAD family phosphatase [Dehalococcoidia bacterium]|jgi:HAD superfamily hydrolase (TIGR01509 family)|nr:HAD family phosphatase [Dehalococcoidia bacterium]
MTGSYRAVIFDLDGVLWDGEPLYHEAFNVVLKPLGHSIALTDPAYVQIIGKSVEAAWEWMRERFALTDSPTMFYRAYDDAVMELMKKPLEPLPGVRELLDELKARGIAVGLASASLRNWVDATLAGLGLNGAFAATMTASEVERSKPAPDLYLKTAKQLGVPPGNCLAFEDTPSGIASARGAGMFAVQVRASSTALPPLPEADLVIESYAEFDLFLLDAAKREMKP